MTLGPYFKSVLRSPTLPWRVASSALLVAYLVLAGEAIHCQYFVDTHDHHGTSQSQSTTHATHCIVANHGSAAISAIASLGFDPLRLLGRTPFAALIALNTVFVSPSSARAPPSV